MLMVENKWLASLAMIALLGGCPSGGDDGLGGAEEGSNPDDPDDPSDPDDPDADPLAECRMLPGAEGWVEGEVTEPSAESTPERIAATGAASWDIALDLLRVIDSEAAPSIVASPASMQAAMGLAYGRWEQGQCGDRIAEVMRFVEFGDDLHQTIGASIAELRSRAVPAADDADPVVLTMEQSTWAFGTDVLPEPTGLSALYGAKPNAMLERGEVAARVCPLDATDLRGWHFVTSGGLLLHLSPFGFSEGMHGRYAMTQDSAVRCRQGLLRLHAVLDEWDQAPSRVLLLPDRSSHVLGLAAAAMYGVPAEPFDAETPGLVVAYDLNRLDQSTPAAVAHHHPEQVLFAHATCWTEPPPCVPDLTTYLYQVNVEPGRELADEDASEPSDAPLDPDDPTVQVAVQAILDAIVDDDPDELPSDKLTNLVTFTEAVRPLTAAVKAEGLRGPMWEGGPVSSNRFE